MRRGHLVRGRQGSEPLAIEHDTSEPGGCIGERSTLAVDTWCRRTRRARRAQVKSFSQGGSRSSQSGTGLCQPGGG